MGTTMELLRKGWKRGLLTGFGLVMDSFKEGLRKQGFALDWMLSGSRSNPMAEYLNSYVTGRKRSSTHSH